MVAVMMVVMPVAPAAVVMMMVAVAPTPSEMAAVMVVMAPVVMVMAPVDGVHAVIGRDGVGRGRREGRGPGRARREQAAGHHHRCREGGPAQRCRGRQHHGVISYPAGRAVPAGWRDIGTLG